MSDSRWSLSYWIRGHDPMQQGSKILANPDTTVDTLKELIRDKSPGLSQYNPASVYIYKVPDDIKVPVSGKPMETALGHLSISMLGEPLGIEDTLLEIFETPPRKSQLHLVIHLVTDNLHIRYWRRGATESQSAEVVVPGFARLDQLKRAIKENQGMNIPETRMVLYKIPSAREDLSERLGEMGSGQLLGGYELLGDSFNDVCFSTPPCVVFEVVPERSPPSRAPPLSRHHPGDDADDPIREKRYQFLQGRPQGAPSTSGAPSSFKKKQTGLAFIPCGRPRRNPTEDDEFRGDRLPTTLLHPVFAEFVDDCKKISEFPSRDTRIIDKLAERMSDLHSTEKDRIDKVCEALEEFGIGFEYKARVCSEKSYTMDACMGLNGHRYVIVEFKNESAGSKTDPYLQAISYYLESTRYNTLKHTRSTLPCLILAIFGPEIVFAGAVWNLRPIVQLLSMPIAFCLHELDDDNDLLVSRHMVAFRKGTRSLREYYDGLTDIHPQITPPPKQLYPYSTSYKSEGQEKIEFQYTEQIFKDKLIFFGTEVQSNEKICIKFSRMYSKDAHRFLASLGHAPKLRGYEEMPGGWIMSVFDALHGHKTLSSCETISPALFDNISTTLSEFHDAGFVHGDFRGVNVMVPETDLSATEFMIIDFEWAGKIGEARYPRRVNTEEIDRPKRELDMQEILKDDDLYMLKNMREQYVR